jgi:4-amino-4-deoxy-L-arabinose transferase-like glycosyltransferase
MTLTSKRSLGILAVACFSLFFLGMSTFGVTDPGEGYYVEAAREMVESGDFITPHLNYQIYFSKPILTFWLMAIPYKIFGVSEFSARIAFSFLATLLVFASYQVGRAFKSEFAGLFAGLAVASSPLIIAVTRLSPIDIAFTCFVDLAVFAFAMAALIDKKQWWWVFHAALALAVLTKGPAGLILFLAGTVAFLCLARPSVAQLKTWFHRLRPARGALIFWAIVLPWYFAIDAATKGLFLLVFFFYENFARFAGHTNLGKSTWWYYLPVIGYGFAPWIVFLPFAAFGILKAQLSAGFKPRNASMAGAQDAAEDGMHSQSSDAKQLFLFYLLIWALSEFLFFSCSKTKMDTYILPSFAPFAVCIALKMEEWLQCIKNADLPKPKAADVLFKAAMLLGAILFVGGPIAAFLIFKAETLSKLTIACAAIVMALGLMGASRFYKKEKAEHAVACFALGFALAAGLCQPIGFQLGSKKRWDDLKLIAEHLQGKDADLAIFNTFKPAVMFYTQRGVDSFFHAHQLKRKAPGDSRQQLVIANDKVIDRLLGQPGINLKLLERSGEWAVYEAVGSKLEKNLTLEDVFTKPQAFEMAISGKGDWGPLTVPYAAGARDWWKKSKPSAE